MGPLGCTLLMGPKLNVALFFPPRWTQGMRLPYMEERRAGGEGGGRGNPGLGDSPSSHRVAADSSITLRGAASIINK